MLKEGNENNDDLSYGSINSVPNHDINPTHSPTKKSPYGPSFTNKLISKDNDISTSKRSSNEDYDIDINTDNLISEYQAGFNESLPTCIDQREYIICDDTNFWSYRHSDMTVEDGTICLDDFPQDLDCIKNYRFKKIHCNFGEFKTIDHRNNVKKQQMFKRLDNTIYCDKYRKYWNCDIGFVQTCPQHYYPQNPNCIKRYFWMIYGFIMSYSMIWGIISELLLLINVYYYHEKKFFILSVVFMCFPLLIGSCIANCVTGYATNKYQYITGFIPIINISTMSMHPDPEMQYFAALLSMFLSGLMSYPLYIINLSFMLENANGSYQNISIFNYIQLLWSLITISISPFLHFLKFTQERSYGYKGLVLSLKDRTKLSFIIAMVFGPIALIEIIHFFPFLFAYYVEHIIDIKDLVNILLIFNLPKIIFIIHTLKRAITSDEFQFIRKHAICETIFTIPLKITIPLILYLMIMISKEKITMKIMDADSNRCKNLFVNGLCSSTAVYYWIIATYLLISYGFSCVYLVYKVGWNSLANPIKISILTLLILCIFFLATFPKLYYYIKKYKILMARVSWALI